MAKSFAPVMLALLRESQTSIEPASALLRKRLSVALSVLAIRLIFCKRLEEAPRPRSPRCR